MNSNDSLPSDPPPDGRGSLHRRLLAGRPGTALLMAPVLAVAIFVLPRIGKRTAPAAPEPRVLAVDTIPVSFVDEYTIEESYTGEVRARRTTRLGFERPGKIIALLVEAGDQVSKNQEVGRLDPRHLEAELARVRASLSEARAALAELVAGPRTERIASQKAQVEAIAAELAQAEADRDRSKKLMATGANTGEEWDAVRFRVVAMTARLSAARKTLDELEAGTRPERIAAQKARITALKSSVSTRKLDLEQAVLRAPFAGSISRRFVDEGSVVNASLPVFEIVESGRLEARVGLPVALAAEYEAALRESGPELPQVQLRVRGHSVDAQLRAILPRNSRTTRTRTLILDLDRPAATPGEVVRWPITKVVKARGAWLPLTALRKGTRGLWSCFVVKPPQHEGENATVATRPLHLIHSEAERALVDGTLSSGEKVISAGVHRVVPGQAIRLQRSR